MTRFNDAIGRAGKRQHDTMGREIVVLNAAAVGGRDIPDYQADANSPIRGTTRRPSGGRRGATSGGSEQEIDIEVRTYNEAGATLRAREADDPPTRLTVGGKTVEVTDIYEEATGLKLLDCVEAGSA